MPLNVLFCFTSSPPLQSLHPASSGLAALTWWLRLQVVSFIAGRRRRSLTTDYLEELTNTLLGAEQYGDVKVGT